MIWSLKIGKTKNFSVKEICNAGRKGSALAGSDKLDVEFIRILGSNIIDSNNIRVERILSR
ncbi:hypothetical protein AKJ39_04735 [candidate division MSBL1 archaeon SCGC-AAA259J03]|uniref:Uncharacterized protein n=1 Tax=candidate division MSBL1 archaeon SCGC-AAA259J03 TaxID=1698269 RepID=A0A656YWQ1_9EURY|nr:hypothetical protein AKJ39_04735 [candidate division MSBL1 archaeon SCGC-AAA259J03]